MKYDYRYTHKWMETNAHKAKGVEVGRDSSYVYFRKIDSAELEIKEGKPVTRSSGQAAPRKTRSRGLGDTIAKATKAVGIKPCGGCAKRQAALNRAVPYKGAGQ